jgi:deoxyribodipyrimidine photo-lyase
LADPEKLLARLDIDRSVPPVSAFRGGYSQARKLLREFIDHKLDHYDERTNDPSLDFTSHLSPYLHFGQISPLEVALAVAEAPGPNEEAFLEQLIVRRELSMNFVHYNPAYDTYDCLPDWAKATLAEHEKDPRPYIYSEDELEQAQTHDPYWNAAQLEMVRAGKMHNYMRMYWGKKILEWSPTPREAFETALRLNNRYELDGRDPNGFTGVAWCFGKHDRPWQERPVFGRVRYMNAAGLERKFKMDAYVAKVAGLVQ